MSALDAQVPPHLINEETRARGRAFGDAPNRTRFALAHFRNAEWMHEDASGIDNGAYGLRAPWEVIVEPDEMDHLFVVVTAYPVNP